MLNAIFRYFPSFGGGGGGGITRFGISRSYGVGDGLGGFGDGMGLGVGFGDGFFVILSSYILEGKDEKKYNSENES